MRRLALGFVALSGLVLAGCESQPERHPPVGGGAFALSSAEKARVLQVSGKGLIDLLVTVAALADEKDVTVESLIQALDLSFEVSCHETCEVNER